jgi:prephenate dehydratase
MSMIIADPKLEQQERISRFISRVRSGKSSKSVYPIRNSLDGGIRDSTN